MTNYCNLHTHDIYSVLDGASTPDEYFKRASELDMPALAITNHGTLSGHRQFQTSAKNAGIKPILGVEGYWTTDRFDRTSAAKRQDGDTVYNHITLLSQNDVGLKNLRKLDEIGWTEGFFSKPRIDMEVLEAYSEGIIALSGCLSGVLCKAIESGNMEQAETYASDFKRVFGDKYFVELMIHNPIDMNSALVDIANKFGLRYVVTSDCHHANKDDLWVQEAMLILGSKPKKATDFSLSASMKMDWLDRFNYLYPERKMTFQKFDLHLNSAEELFAGLQKHGIGQEALDNTLIVADMVDSDNYPYYEGLDLLPKVSDDVDGDLRRMVFNGLKRLGVRDDDEYVNRAEHELKVIKDKGFATYFLIAEDAISWARSQGILVGAGRGSGAGSLVCWALDLTRVDPIQHKLLFERFIDYDRADWPDLDSDIEDTRREEVKNYLRTKYNDVASIATFGFFKDKSALRAAARVLSIPLGEVNKALKVVVDMDDYRNNSAVSGFRNKYPEVLRLAERLQGRIQNVGVHAGGLVISDRPLSDIVPIQTAKSSNDASIRVNVVAYDMNEVANVGLIKYDFLGLKALSTVSDCLAAIKKYKGVDIDIYNLPLDNQSVYDMLSRGETLGVFQAEARPYTKMLIDIGGVKNFEELTASNALVRPGAANADFYKQYVDGKNGGKVTYLHKDMEPFLKDTYGACLFQDTEVVTARGPIMIKDLHEGDTVYGTSGPSTVSQVVHTGAKKGFELTFGTGRKLIASSDHKFLTPYGYKSVAELTDSDMIAVPKSIDFGGGIHDPDDGWIWGMLIAEGSFDTSSPTIANNDEEIMTEFERLIDKRYPDCATRRFFNTRSWYISVKKLDRYGNGGYHSSNSLRSRMTDLGLSNMTKANKFVPSYFYEWDLETRSAFLGGWISGDGTVSSSQASIRTAYRHMAESAHDMLLSVGVFSRICECNDGSYIISIMDSQAYNRILRPHVVGPKSRIEYNVASELGVAPNPLLDKTYARGELSSLSTEAGHHRGWAGAIRRSGNIITRRQAEEIGYASDYYWTTVSVEESGIVDMVDIEVDDSHSFTVQGVMSHNCLFQEQMMQYCTVLAGMSVLDSNKVRKAVSKKKPEELAKWKDMFIDGASKRITRTKATRLWKNFEASADYSFNKSHSVAYSLLTYQTAWLKLHYPVEFMYAILKNETNIKSKLDYMREAKRLGVKIKLPHVNYSDVEFAIHGDALRIGLADIKYIGEKQAARLIRERPFADYAALVHCISTKGNGLNSRVLESMNKVGASAFDDNVIRREDIEKNFFEYLNIPKFNSDELPDSIMKRIRPLDEWADDETFLCLGMVQAVVSKNGWTRVDLVDETEQAGAFVNDVTGIDPGTMYVFLIGNNSIMAFTTIDDILNPNSDNKFAQYLTAERPQIADDVVRVVAFNSRLTRNGKLMGDVTLEDEFGELLTATVWPSHYPVASTRLKPGAILDIGLKENNRGYSIDYIKEGR